MMNVVALCLVVSSLAAAGVWSPTPQKEDVIVKEGHRVIVVEYDEDGKRNTKVSISNPPPQQQQQQKSGEYFDKESIKEAASVLPNLGQGISPQGKAAGTGRHSPGELVCDAFGKCTHKLAAALGKAKDKVSDTADEAKEKVSETADEAAEKAGKTALGAKEKVAETAQQTKEAVGYALGRAKEAVVQKGQDVKEGAKGSIDKAKDGVKAAKDTANAGGEHIVSNVTEKAENVRHKAVEEARDQAKKVKTGANRFFNGLKYITSLEALNSVMGMANLLGLATAYGMSVWVTFISSYVLAGVLPRQQFGVVQSKIYPVYFRAMAYSIGLALLGHVLGQRKRLFSSKPEIFQAYNLLSSLSMVLVNALYLEPKATKVMFEKMKLEKEEGRGRDPDFVAAASRATEPPTVTEPAMATRTREAHMSPAHTNSEQEVVKSRVARLNERLKKLNSNSSLLNVLTLMALTWHLVYLGQRLSIKC